MNRLDAALVHLYAALNELGVQQPVTRPQIFWRIYMELLRQAMRIASDSFDQNER